MHRNKRILLTAVSGKGSMVFENAADLAEALGVKRHTIYSHLDGHAGEAGKPSGKVNYMGRAWYVDYLFEKNDIEH